MTQDVSSTERSISWRWCLHNPVELLGVLLTISLTVVVFLQVFYRYALQSPLAWSEEFAMFLFQWCSFMGAAIAVRRGFHYGLDLFTKHLPRRGKIGMQILGSVSIFFVSCVMIEKGFDMVLLTMPQKYPVLKFPVAYAYVAIVISGILMIIYQVPMFLHQIRTFIGARTWSGS